MRSKSKHCAHSGNSKQALLFLFRKQVSTAFGNGQNLAFDWLEPKYA